MMEKIEIETEWMKKKQRLSSMLQFIKEYCKIVFLI